jgi:hypothetical protein
MVLYKNVSENAEEIQSEDFDTNFMPLIIIKIRSYNCDGTTFDYILFLKC